jgi:UDP-N-acetyl-D-mannosaminuronate dehydrogenase
VLGVAYIEDSDDIRNTPAEQFIRDLEVNGAEVVAHDPHVWEFPEAELTKDLDIVLRGSDCMAIVKKTNLILISIWTGAVKSCVLRSLWMEEM